MQTLDRVSASLLPPGAEVPAVRRALESISFHEVLKARGAAWGRAVYGHHLEQSLRSGSKPEPIDFDHAVRAMGFNPTDACHLEFWVIDSPLGVVVVYGGPWEALTARALHEVFDGADFSLDSTSDEQVTMMGQTAFDARLMMWSQVAAGRHCLTEDDPDHLMICVPGGMTPSTFATMDVAAEALTRWHTFTEAGLAMMLTGSQGGHPSTVLGRRRLEQLHQRARNAFICHPELIPDPEEVINGDWEGFTAEQLLVLMGESVPQES